MLHSENMTSIEHPLDETSDHGLRKIFKDSSDIALVSDEMTALNNEDCATIAERFAPQNKKYELKGILPDVQKDPAKVLDQLRDVLSSVDGDATIVLLRFDKESTVLSLDQTDPNSRELEINTLKVHKESVDQFSIEDKTQNIISDHRLIQFQYGVETSGKLAINQKILVYGKKS